VFSSSLVYNLPGLEGRNGFLKGVAGGWETSTVVSLATGNALTITGQLNGDTCLTNCGLNTQTNVRKDPWGVNGNASQNHYSVRPLRVPGKSCFTGNNLQYINPNAFTMNGYVLGQRPTGGIGQCYGPNIRNVDFALDKNWGLPKVGERVKLQFRLEFFNLLNHPMFRYGSSSADSNANLNFVATGGQIVNGVVTGTTLQAGSSFGDTPNSSNLGNREIQYALKVIF
jgi:hypothetical protein